VIETRVPVFSRLSDADQRELLGHAHVLIEEKHFEGAGGLLMRDEVRLTIAAQAALLLLHRETDYFPRLTSVIVYPSGYVATNQRAEGGIWSEDDEHLSGHTQRNLRALVLAWDDVKAGAADPNDGRNLVLHEFAHQLDFEDGSTDGTPALESAAQARSWAEVFGTELEALRRAADAGEPTLLDPYGAQDPRSSSRSRPRPSSSEAGSSLAGILNCTRSSGDSTGRIPPPGSRTPRLQLGST